MSDQSFAASIGGEFHQDRPSADDIVHALGLRGVLQRAERAGLQRSVAVALAERLKPEERLNFNQAILEVEHNVEIAIGVITRATNGSSGIDEANVVLEKVVERTLSADFDSAVRALDDALAEIDHLEEKQQEAAHRRQVLFLQAAIKQHTLRRDAVGVVSRIERLVALDHTSDRLTGLRARYNEYLAEGDTKGLNFSLLIAVECARRMIEVSGRKERGAALVDLGNALSTLGQRESGVIHLLEAVEVSREALKELTHDRAPLHWAIVQNNLGVMLCTLGQRENGTERLVEAVEACREALKERTRERVPRQWAITQNNLGNALSKLGERERGTERLLEAVEAYRNALGELTDGPIDRAMTQSNLGNALSLLGERENDTKHLIEAVDVYREALKNRTRERAPLEWAMTQNNLGNVLRVLGQRENSKERLVEAVEVCCEALKERTRERVPLDWATTHNNLGNALLALGQRESDLGRLHEAIEAYHEALKELTRENMPLEWSKARNNLISAQTILNGRLGFGGNTSLSFEEPNQRQNSDLVSTITDYTDPVPGVITAHGQGQETQNLNTGIMDKAARIQAAAELLATVYPEEDIGEALEGLAAKEKLRELQARAGVSLRPIGDLLATADELGVSRSDVFEFIERRAKREVTGNTSTVDAANADDRLSAGKQSTHPRHETTVRRRNTPTVSAEAELITQQLPSSLQPKRPKKKKREKSSVVKEANRILSQFERDRRKGKKFTDEEIKASRAARNIIRRSQRLQGPTVG